MLLNIASTLRSVASEGPGVLEHWSNILNNRYGINAHADMGVHGFPELVRELCLILKPIPIQLVKDCGINTIQMRSDMGPNKPYYPNHGYFTDNTVGLNADCFYHPDRPDDFVDHRGYFLTRAQQTAIHEFGHGFDAHHDDLCLKSAWLRLSGWSEDRKQGLKKQVIREPGMPERVGEWWYDPHAGFTRFYGKMNPWDDWADCFAFYVGGLRHKIPADKNGYFDDLLGRYYV